MIKHICLITCSVLVLLTSFSQSRRKSKSGQKLQPLVFADSSSIKRYSDSIKHAAYLADTLTDKEGSNGIKDLLHSTATNTTDKLSATDGFLHNSLVKISVPPADQKSERGLRSLGYSKQVDEAIASINHTAEDACKTANPILQDMINKTDFINSKQLLKGSDSAGTLYLKQAIYISLSSSVRPIVVASMEKVGTSKYWATAFNTINKFGLNTSGTDLAGYITDKTIAGIFLQMEMEEQAVRADPKTKSSALFLKLNKQ